MMVQIRMNELSHTISSKNKNSLESKIHQNIMSYYRTSQRCCYS